MFMVKFRILPVIQNGTAQDIINAMISSSIHRSTFNILNLFIAIVGILIGVYFYYQSRQTKDISYQIDKSASKIYDIKNTSSLIRLIEKDTILIKENVYYVRGKIWNSGNLPIQSNDIRKPLTITLNSCKRILDYKIEKQYEDNTQGFVLTKTNNNSLKISWKYFDPKNGFSFQVIYLGDENLNGKLKGKILGISQFNEINSNTENSNWLYFFVITVCLAFGWFADILFPKVLGRQGSLNIFWRTFLVITLSMILSLGVTLIFKMLTKPFIPF